MSVFFVVVLWPILGQLLYMAGARLYRLHLKIQLGVAYGKPGPARATAMREVDIWEYRRLVRQAKEHA